MHDFYKKTNKVGNPVFEVHTSEGACKMIFDADGRIVKALCGPKDKLCLVYSKDNANESCLKDSMYEMSVLSQECFMEMVAEISSEDQIACAKEVAARRNAELTELSVTAMQQAVELNSIL